MTNARNRPLLMPVVAAVLSDEGGRVLMQQRPEGKQHGGLWEFPGGKIEEGETPERALARELMEELGIVIDPTGISPLTFFSAPLNQRHLLLMLFRCTRWHGEARPLHAAALEWRLPSDLAELLMPPGDRAFVEWLIRSR